MFRRLWRWLLRLFDRGRTVEELADWLGLSREELEAVPVSYYEFRIPKRSRGERCIQAPNEQLKRVQRRIYRRLLRKLKSHPCAIGFEPGQSIVDNAEPHRGAAVLLKLDVVDFFPSILDTEVWQSFRLRGWSRDACDLLTRLCTYNGVLPQGASTSPKLSNLVNRGLDRALDNIADSFCANYTRYADDLTFSFARDEPHQVTDLLYNVRGVLGRMGYEVHHRRKLSVRRPHQRQQVTGLVINGEARPRLPRATRRWLRAVRHRVRTNRLSTLSPAQRAGWESLERMVDG
jgi:RNA-directed DNA polymerase